MVALLICVAFFAVVLAPWVHFLLGPSVSIYDLGAPQLRAFT